LHNAPKTGRGQKILIVEDDPSLAELAKLAFMRGGFVAQVAKDVVSAIRVINQAPPALIVVDIMLPSIRGTELPRYIRRDAAYPMIPVIVMSALSDEKTVKEAIEAGADIYVGKPANLKELVRVASALILRSEQQRPERRTKQLSTGSIAPAEEPAKAAKRLDTLIAFVEGGRDPISFTVLTQVSIGREAIDSPNRHIDLETFGAFDKGVSRVHALFIRNGEKFMIKDAASSNGTFLNGTQVPEGDGVEIHSGDELRLGRLKMEIYILGSEE
jgi:CheY-like chemotaxis protein